MQKSNRRSGSCCGKPWGLERVTFKNGTEHIARRCSVCGAHGDYLSKSEIQDIEAIPVGKTDREKRIEAGLPVGCRICGTETGVQIIGFCGKCRYTEDARRILQYAKRDGRSVFALEPDELVEALGISDQTLEFVIQ